jgi:hypothetical protein
VTPPELPEWAQINCVDADPFEPGCCWVAATRYKLDDFRPYLFVTKDYGATWRQCDTGIDPRWFTRCVRADPVQKGIVYAGTERSVWVSFNDGRQWQRLQRNLPIVPICDLTVKNGALIAATQGRSFWSFDHLAHLRQLSPEMGQQDVVLFAAVPFVQFGGSDAEVAGQGRNPQSAPIVRVLVNDREPVDLVIKPQPDGSAKPEDSAQLEHAAKPEAAKPDAAKPDAAKPDAGKPAAPKPEIAAKLEILDQKGKVLWTRDSKAEKDEDKLTLKRGMNTLRWEPKFEDAKRFDGMILWSGGLGGPRKMPPGTYSVRLTYGDKVQTQPLVIDKDPRTYATTAELQQKYDFVVECRDVINKAHEAIIAIRSLRTQIDAVVARTEGDAKKELEAKAKDVKDALTAIEETLYQTKSKSGQDPLNYPIKLTDKLAGAMSAVNGAEFGPTQGQLAVKNDLVPKIQAELDKFEAQKKDGVAAFNALAVKLAVPYVK